jgi:hypothetical protein
MTQDQKLADFRNLADTVAKNYAPYEWKKQILAADPLTIGPWLDRVRQTQTDVEFWELCAEYIASLRDSHTFFVIPSTFNARLGFTVDIYEGKFLIDSIDREVLPAEQFPFQIGDELRTIDGRPAEEIARELARFVGEGNAVTQLRGAAGALTRRDQALLPRAHEVPDESAIEVQSAGGEAKTYRIPWRKEGIPVSAIPNSPDVRTAKAQTMESLLERLAPRKHRNWRVPDRWVIGLGATQPVFELPADSFTQRVGRSTTDRVVSGVFTRGDRRIGYLRLPAFTTTRVAQQAQQELLFFRSEAEGRANTDALILDLTRNVGGSTCLVDEILPYLLPDGYTVFTAEFRVTWFHLLELRDTIEFLKLIDADPTEIEEVEFQLAAFEEAVKAGKPRSAKLPVCGTTYQRGPAIDRTTREVVAYRKPIIVLVDEFTASAGEMMAAVLQDASRVTTVGKRTAGAGGASGGALAGVYSEAEVALAIALGTRTKDIVTDDLPTVPYIENVGIRPEISLELMTRDNLVNKGKPYLDRVLEIAAEKIQAATAQ